MFKENSCHLLIPNSYKMIQNSASCTFIITFFVIFTEIRSAASCLVHAPGLFSFSLVYLPAVV